MTSARQVATHIVRRLRDAGHVAYFAGGCVRDELLGLMPDDYDIATDATPDQVRPLFRHFSEVGASFGVMLVREKGHTVEVATFREEGAYSDSRRPDEVRFADAEADAKRRDFTINALFLDPLRSKKIGDDTGVIDLVGGRKDLRRKIIRAVGDPEHRLAEDHLRALRGVRLATRLRFEIEDATAAAISRHALELRGVSRERIGDELRKMLAHPTRALAAARLQRLGLDAPTLDEAPAKSDDLAALKAAPTSAAFAPSLAAWVVDRAAGKPINPDALATRLRKALLLSNDERDEVAATLRHVAALPASWDGAGVAARKRMAVSRGFDAALWIVGARQPETEQRVREALEALESDGVGLSPRPLVTGDDLVAAGLEPGPPFKAALDAAYDAQLEGRAKTPEEAMRIARGVVGG